MFLCITGKAQKYRVGDVYYNQKGEKEGVVCWIDPSGTKGWLVAFNNLGATTGWGIPYPWGTVGEIPGLPEIADRLEAIADENGYNNTKIIRNFLGEGSQYAAQTVDFDNGWYIPSMGQMRKLSSIYTMIDPVLVENGGKPLFNRVNELTYWTSTPANSDYTAGESVYYLKMKEYLIGFEKGKKSAICYVRPVRDFIMDDAEEDASYTYRWNTGETTSKLVTTPGSGKNDYKISVTSVQGNCAGSAEKSVLVASADEILYRDTICRGERYRKNGFDTDVPGEHSQTLTVAEGCSVPVKLHLTVADTFHVLLSDRFCRGSFYSKYNFTAYYGGDYVQRWQTDFGCDSVVSLRLEENRPFDTTYYASVCRGEAYAGHGFTIAEVLQDTFCMRNPGTPEGCDSLVQLLLTVRNPAEQRVYDTICRGNGYRGYEHFDIARVTKDTVCSYRTVSSAGCDSTLWLFLKVLDLPEKWIDISVCEGEAYTSYGFNETETGVYENRWPALTGKCDTIVHLNLKVNPVFTVFLKDSVCAGEKYTGNDLFDILPITKDTLCEVTVPSVQGCDSSVHLDLKWLPLKEKELQVSILKGEVYKGYGLNTGEAGYYEVEWPASKGCDTIVKIELKVLEEFVKQISASICEGKRYTEYGFDRIEPGLDTVKLKGKDGARDTLICLSLQVNPIYDVWKKDTICRGEHYEFCGNVYTDEGSYVYRSSTVLGCDSIAHLELSVGDYFEGEIVSELKDCETYAYAFSLEGTMPETVKFPRYVWEFGEEEKYEEETVLHHFADSGKYPVILRITNEWKCDKVLEKDVSVSYYPSGAELLTDVSEIDEDHPVVDFRTDSVAGLRYKWDFGDGSMEENGKFAISHRYTLSSATFYDVSVWLTNAENCVVEASTRIKAYPVFDVPNTFSPNGDGVNDVFMKGGRVKIIDRNGVKIWEGEDGWDGSYKGSEAPEDTYFYEVTIFSTRGERKQTGYLILVR